MNKILYLSLLVIYPFFTRIHCQTPQKTKYIDVIYFKDGSSVKGTIVYQIPKVRVSIKRTNIRTLTDSVYTYPMIDIAKIVKEPISGNMEETQVISDRRLQAEGNVATTNSNNPKQSLFEPSNTPQMSELMIDKMQFKPIVQTMKADVPKPMYNDVPALIDGKNASSDEIDLNALYRRANERHFGWYRDIKGIRVFLDYAYTQGFGTIKNNRFDWATSLGFQFDPIFYLGVGLSYSMTLNNKESSVPLFINPRINFIDSNVTPYFDFKGGYSPIEGKGLYFNPSVGISCVTNRTQALSIGIGYTYQKSKYKNWSEKQEKKIHYNDTYNGIQLKLTYEFNIYTIK